MGVRTAWLSKLLPKYSNSLRKWCQSYNNRCLKCHFPVGLVGTMMTTRKRKKKDHPSLGRPHPVEHPAANTPTTAIDQVQVTSHTNFLASTQTDILLQELHTTATDTLLQEAPPT